MSKYSRYFRDWWKNNWKIEKYFDIRLNELFWFLICSFLTVFYFNNQILFLVFPTVLVILSLAIFKTDFIKQALCLVLVLGVILLKIRIQKILSHSFHNVFWIYSNDEYKTTLIDINSNSYYLPNNVFKLENNHLLTKLWIQHEIHENHIVKVFDYKILNSYDFRYYYFKILWSLDKVYEQSVISILYGFGVNYNYGIIKTSKDLGIIHFLIISGMHFNILFAFLVFVFRKKFTWIAYLLVIIYWLICYKSISVNRAFISLIINKLVKKKFNISNDFLITFYLTIIFTLNLKILSSGFWLSFLLSFYLKLWKSDKKWIYYLMQYFNLWIISVSLQLIWQDKIYVSSWIISMVLSPIIEFFYLGLTFLLIIPVVVKAIINLYQLILSLFTSFSIIIQNNYFIQSTTGITSSLIFFAHFFKKNQNKI